MFIRFFKNNNPSSFILLPLFALALRIGGFFSEHVFAAKYNMPLYEILTKPFNSFHFTNAFSAFILTVGEAFLLNYVVNKNEILTKPSFLPALFFIVFMSCDSSLFTLHPLLLASLFLLLAINKSANSYQKDAAFSNAFDAGVLLSLSALFYFPSIVFLPLLGIGFIMFRPFNWREWVISFIGLMLPYIFVFTYYFWNDKLGNWWDVKMFFSGLQEQSQTIHSKSFYFMIAVCLLIILLSFGKLFTGLAEASQKNQKGILLLVWFSVFGLVSVFVTPEISILSFSPLAIPASVFCANYFLKIKKGWWGELLFILLLFSIFINHLSHYF